MYIKLSDVTIQDKPTLDKPDLAMMKKAYELFFYGTDDDEVVGFGQYYKGSNFKFLKYSDFKNSIDNIVKWQAQSKEPCVCFQPNPIRTNYPTTPKGTPPVSRKVGIDDVCRVRWFLLDIDRIETLRYPDGKKNKANDNYLPATKDQVKQLDHATQYLVDSLEDLGFKGILTNFSGNGFGIAIPVAFPISGSSETFAEFINLLKPFLGDFPEVEIDSAFSNPSQPWGLVGTLNTKGGARTLRRALNHKLYSGEDLEGCRRSNTVTLEAHLASQQPEVKELPEVKQTTPAKKDDGKFGEYLEMWDKDNPLKQMLMGQGYDFIKDLSTGATWLERPDRGRGEPSIIVGGKKDRLWNLSSGDPYFKQHIAKVDWAIRPYIARLMIDGIMDRDGKTIDKTRQDAFFLSVRQKYQPSFDLRKQVKLDSNTLTAIPAEQGPNQATGTLADTPLPGTLETIAQDIGLRNATISPAIDRAMAIFLYQGIIGKSRVHESGTYCNSWLVNLAPTSAGKEAGKNYAQRFMNQVAEEFELSKVMPNLPPQCYGYKIVGVNGANGGSAEGIQDDMLMHGRLMIIGDESERFIHPGAKNDKAIGIRDTLLSASAKGRVIGRSLAGNASRKSITHGFVSQIHITQPQPYFEAFENENDFKGSIGRYIHFEADKGYPRLEHKDFEISQGLILEGKYWQAENLKGLEKQIDKLMGTIGKDQVPYLGRFKPEQTVMAYAKQICGEAGRVYEYRKHCHEQAKKEGIVNNRLIERFWDKAAENALRFAMTAACALDRTTTEISSEAWDWATNQLEESRKALDSNRGNILKPKSKEREDILMAQILNWDKKEELNTKTLYAKVRGRYRNGEVAGKPEFDHDIEMLNGITLVPLDQPGRPVSKIIINQQEPTR
jgi:hypothetical protein